ncbi:MAG: AI-2E family transporter [Myxococcota bacterium]
MTTSKTSPWFQSIALIVFLSVLFVSRYMVILTLIGVGIGVLLTPILDRAQTLFKLKRGYAALLVFVTFLLSSLALLLAFGWIIVDQANAFVAGFPELSLNVQSQLERLFNNFPWLRSYIQNIDMSDGLKTLLFTVGSGAHDGLAAFGGAVVAIFIGLYLAVEADYYFRGFLRAVPAAYQKRTEHILSRCGKVTQTWFVGQLLDMAIIGLLTTAGLWLVGVDYWAFFGLLTAIFGIIPYVGTLIVVVAVSLVTLATDIQQIPWVLLVFFITQQIEGNILLPMVMKAQVQIPEALLVIAMLFFGFWFGLLGVFIATPLTAILLCLYHELYLVEKTL